MPRWLQSGLRRDLCLVVAADEGPTETEAKAALEAHYGERVRPQQYHGAVDALVRQGYLERTADGLQDRLWLSEEGRDRLLGHLEWIEDLEIEIA